MRVLVLMTLVTAGVLAVLGFASYQANVGYYAVTSSGAHCGCSAGATACLTPCSGCCDTAPEKTCTVTTDPTCRAK